jgi:hypothetical protein
LVDEKIPTIKGDMTSPSWINHHFNYYISPSLGATHWMLRDE